jgi:hypothetical protein
MTDIELIDALNFFLQHHPTCLKEPCTCGLNAVFETLMHRLIPSEHPVPADAGLYDRVCDLWEPSFLPVTR